MIARRLCVVTGSRADFGLLRWILEDLRDDPEFELRIVATAMHLSPEFGLTIEEIEDSGFTVDERVEMLLSGDSEWVVAKSVGLGVIGMADAFRRIEPDLVVVLGDRFEILAAAQAAMFAGIPIAHLHGGERSEGAVDESIRHAVTKMAHYHFVAAASYGRRVVQLGEDPSRVFAVGAPGLDVVVRGRIPDPNELRGYLQIPSDGPLVLVTYHPETRGHDPSVDGLEELTKALDALPEIHVLVTAANADAGGRSINARLEDWILRRSRGPGPGLARFVTSLGQERYIGALRASDLVVGNSSSGLIEAPAVGTPTVNIGERQRGRLRASSVLDAPEERDAIEEAIRSVLSGDFPTSPPGEWDVPYGRWGASERIVELLREIPLERHLVKEFRDLPDDKVRAR